MMKKTKTKAKKPFGPAVLKRKKNLNSKDLAMLIAKAADDKKAIDIKIIELKRSSPLTDFIVICTGDVGPHIDAISSHIEEKLRKEGKKHIRWEGSRRSNWRVLDIGSIIVHVMGEEERRRYNLDELFEKSAIIFHL